MVPCAPGTAPPAVTLTPPHTAGVTVFHLETELEPAAGQGPGFEYC